MKIFYSILLIAGIIACAQNEPNPYPLEKTGGTPLYPAIFHLVNQDSVILSKTKFIPTPVYDLVGLKYLKVTNWCRNKLRFR